MKRNAANKETALCAALQDGAHEQIETIGFMLFSMSVVYSK